MLALTRGCFCCCFFIGDRPFPNWRLIKCSFPCQRHCIFCSISLFLFSFCRFANISTFSSNLFSTLLLLYSVLFVQHNIMLRIFHTNKTFKIMLSHLSTCLPYSLAHSLCVPSSFVVIESCDYFVVIPSIDGYTKDDRFVWNPHGSFLFNTARVCTAVYIC